MSSHPPAVSPIFRVVNEPNKRQPLSRIDSNNGRSTPLFGKIYWAPGRSIWFALMYGGAIIGGGATFQWDAFILFVVTSAIALCAGYSVGIHRRLIHNSFQCYPWVEAVLVYLGVLAGIGGPFALIERHDIQYWAQTHPRCHDYFTSRRNPFTDWFWAMHCGLQLNYPPVLRYEPRLADNKFYQWLEQTWMFQQLPWAIAFYYFGGWSWVFWGIYVRISVCATLIWLANYLTSKVGHRLIHTEGAAIQYGNIPVLSLLSMGESWQNNHQNAPGSARFGSTAKQIDPGWWFIRALSYVGFAWNISQPEKLIHTQAKSPYVERLGQAAIPTVQQSVQQSVQQPCRKVTL